MEKQSITHNQFRFALNQKVTIDLTGETGTIVGRSEYLLYQPMYQVFYKTATGTNNEQWFFGEHLSATENTD